MEMGESRSGTKGRLQRLFEENSIKNNNDGRQVVFRFTPEGTQYSGSLNLNDFPHGQGSMWYALSDCVYVGSWREGLRHGKGTLTWGNGDCYDGSWENDAMTGWGTFTDSDGSTFVGSWKNGVPEGDGKMTHINGTNYEGRWVNGKCEGEGAFVFDSGEVYSGPWKAGEMADASRVARLRDASMRSGAVSGTLDEAVRRSSIGRMQNSGLADEAGRRSSIGRMRSSLFVITDFEHSYQVYPKNFKDFCYLVLMLFFVGLGMYLIM